VKKLVAILLTVVYLLSAIGVSATGFYCCGMLVSASISIGGQLESKKVIATSHPCCKTTRQVFKVHDSHFRVVSFSILARFFPATMPFVSKDKHIESTVGAGILIYGKAPPCALRRSIYILNCTYRI